VSTKLYKYYQKTGGSEDWKAVHAEKDLSEVSPTFVTVLSLDRLLDGTETREELDAVKYLGPLYFDLDSADIEESIAGGKKLLDKLTKAGLEESQVSIFLSGKKGLHFTIEPSVFIAKVVPVARLPAIYKEIAFDLAVNTLDFAVYTAKRGRMFRTCYNQRENGNYKVPITVEELNSLTAESYEALCKYPRVARTANATYNEEFSLVFDKAQQKISSIKKRKPKVTDRQTLVKLLPDVQRILKCDGLADLGFNKLAIQLAVFARESNWGADELVENAQELVNKHVSDGRYSTPRKREHELRRMFDYVHDNEAYTFDEQMLKSCLSKKKISLNDIAEESDESFEDEDIVRSIFKAGNCYRAAATTVDGATKRISNFIFKNIEVLWSPFERQIAQISATVLGNDVILTPKSFTASATLQNSVAACGGSFTGTDNHARELLDMISEQTPSSYAIHSEGLNMVNLPAHPDKDVSTRHFLVWADRFTLVKPPWLEDYEVDLKFVGLEDTRGLYRTDLTRGPSLQDFFSSQSNRLRAALMLKNMFTCASPLTVGRMLGWMAAAHYKAIFQKTYGKFPMLHVYGMSGLGKTEFTSSFLKLFYLHEEPRMVTPATTPFAFSQLMGASASIPLLLDEWKPSMQPSTVTEKYRALFRDIYNGKGQLRGGGNKTNASLAALTSVPLSAPLIYVAEAPETEPAIVERSIMVPFKRGGGTVQGLAQSIAFAEYKDNLDIWSVVGRHIAASAVMSDFEEEFKPEFAKLLDWVTRNARVTPEDTENLKGGALSKRDYDRKLNVKDRPVYNSAVALYGLRKIRDVFMEVLQGHVFCGDIEAAFKNAATKILIADDEATQVMPEYLKVFTTMSDMSRITTSDGAFWINDGTEFEVVAEEVEGEEEGSLVLNLAPRFAYAKYRQYCKHVGLQHLYPSENSFEISLREVPTLLGYGEGTTTLDTKTYKFSVTKLVEAGVPMFRCRKPHRKPSN